MKRLFSIFPGGLAGIALLLLRLTAGAVLISSGASIIGRADQITVISFLISGLAIASGLSLLLGLFTRLGSVVGTLCSATAPLFPIHVDALNPSQFVVAAAIIAVVAASLGLLGPGAFSIDSRLFGRRKIVFRLD